MNKIRDSKGRFVKGHKVPLDWRDSWSEQFTGKKMSNEQIEKQRIRMQGNSINLGKKRPNQTGENHWNYKNGIIKDDYKRIIHNGKYFREHHVNWMNANNFWYIPDGFVVHHRNLDKLDNRPENLILMPREIHTSWHWKVNKMNNNNLKRGD